MRRGLRAGERLVVQPERVERSRPEVLDEDVGAVAQPQRDVACLRDVQVDRDVALPGVLLGVVAGDAVRVDRRRQPGHVGVRRLDLDDVGAEVLQRPRAQRPGEDPGEVDDPQARQRSGHDRHLPTNLARPGPFVRNDSSPMRRSSDAHSAAWRSSITASAAVDAVVGGQAGQLLGDPVGDGRAVGQLQGDGASRVVELVVVDHPVDQVPALQRRGVVAATEHRHLLGAQRTGPLHLPLHGAHQRVEPEGHLDRADLGCPPGEDEVAREGQLEAAADAGAVHRGDDRERERLDAVEELDRGDLDLAAVDRPVEHGDVGAGAEVLEAAAQQHCS